MNDPLRLDPAQHAWMTAPGIAAILKAIEANGGQARFVGGAVRDALLDRQVEDVDLAVNLPPDAVMKALTQAGIKTVPTGWDHGTVTAVAGHKGYEITTLRKDVETFGRRATVAFTDDWREDAARRDFTMNALYADASGQVYDYFNGYTDLLAGRVRFIGIPEERIQEDVLRILRFFRFQAWLGKGDADAQGLVACGKLASLLPQLSVERIWREIYKLLLAPDPAPAFQMMAATKVLAQILPEAQGLARLEKLVALERQHQVPPHSLRRLTAVVQPEVTALVAQRLRFSNRDRHYLHQVSPLPANLQNALDDFSLRRLLYTHGAELVRDGLLLLAASGNAFALNEAFAMTQRWTMPAFPLHGADILQAGVRAGPLVGAILEAVREWWIVRDFRPSKIECLDEARRIVRPC